MRNKLPVIAVFAVSIVLAAAVVVGAPDRRDRDRDVIGYNVLAERIFKGTVASKGHVVEGLMYFPLRMANTIVEAQIGPKEFVERSGFKTNTGDMVTVVGMPLTIKERQVILAREVSSMNGVLVVRDQIGRPLWERDRPMRRDAERLSRVSKQPVPLRSLQSMSAVTP